VLAGICGDGVWPSVELAAGHPERVLGIVALAPGVPFLVPPHPWRAAALETYEEEFDAPEGWEKENRHYMRADHRGFLEFFFGEMFPEPHSTKQIEDCVGWALETTPETLVTAQYGRTLEPEEARELAQRLDCPLLVVHGRGDAISHYSRGAALAEHGGGGFVVIEGGGHAPHARDPVAFNRLVHNFLERLP
jgi:pimeloyl-ACP methyl ester carboxylesterase